jgi:iron complex transport system ATP-binding protein
VTELILDQLAVTVRGHALLHPVDATLRPGRITAVVGANGAGKSTLLRAIAALIPAAGAARYGAQKLAKMAPRDRARLLAYLPQAQDIAWSMPVRDMVALGRYAFGEAPDGVNSAAIDQALDACGIAHLADRAVDCLSGGEHAMAALARVLVTGAPLLLLDEPVAALDVGRQYQLLEQLSALAASGRTLVIVLHDLALVSQFADRILWLDQGRLVAETPNSRDAIDAHAARLLGRAPQWAATSGGLFFARE